MARKKRNTEEPENRSGSPAWMTTFSDMMTLLLTFFILLYSFSSLDAEKFKLVAASLQSVLSGNPATIIFQNDEAAADQVPLETPVEVPRQEVVQADQWQREQELLAMYEAVSEAIEERGLKAELEVTVSTRGILVNISEAVLFDSGRAEIKVEGRQLLDLVAGVLMTFENEVEVQGHTDNRPINTARYPTNWELSVDRAVSVVRYMTDVHGITPGRLKAAGYGEFRPVAPNNTAENRALNRRVNLLIIVEDEETGGAYGTAY